MGVVSSVSLGIPVSLQVASTNTQASNTQLQCRLPKVFGSLFCECDSHSPVDNTECCFRFIFPADAKKRERPEKNMVTKLKPRL